MPEEGLPVPLFPGRLPERAVHGPDPVSYTHLDVYKRQRLARTKREGDVITVIESDARVDEATIKNLMGVQDVLRVISMPKF